MVLELSTLWMVISYDFLRSEKGLARTGPLKLGSTRFGTTNDAAGIGGHWKLHGLVLVPVKGRLAHDW